MSYSEFTLETIKLHFGITLQETVLFPDGPAVQVPDWLPGLLTRGTRLALISEKARSEFIVVPILLAAREQSGNRFAIYSGQRLDVDQDKGLVGLCDFLLAAGPALPPLQNPFLTVLQAKNHDVEAGLGPCIAQMLGIRQFHAAAGRRISHVYGCVTTGEIWQFLQLADQVALLNQNRPYLDNVSKIFTILQTICHNVVKNETDGPA